MSKKPWFAGLLQALGVLIYCVIVSGVFQLLKGTTKQPPEFLIASFMLLFLVFSAATTGALVFGYPVYLAMNKEIKKALWVLLSTLAFCVVFGGLLAGFLAFLS